MNLQTYNAPTTAIAMSQIRQELGDDAVIVSSRRDADGGVRIVASREAPTGNLSSGNLSSGNPPIGKSIDALDAWVDSNANVREFPTRPSTINVDDAVIQALIRHGTPGPLAERLAHAAGVAGSNPLAALTAALESEFTFPPLPSMRDVKPVLVIGPPGSGKTATVAKLAARDTMAGHSVGVISTDCKRAGANEQLAAFTKVLKVEQVSALNAQELPRALAKLADKDAIYIDTAQVNPFADADMARVREFISVTPTYPVLVMAAGGDAMEADEMARAFASTGIRRLIVTRLDVTRRLGSILAAATNSRFGFSGVSITPRIANGLTTISAVSLARLIMPEAEQFELADEPSLDDFPRLEANRAS